MFRTLSIAATLLFATSVVFAVAVDATPRAPQPAQAAHAAAAATLKPVLSGSLPPLPKVDFEPVEPMPVVQQVYTFAARHPEILSYIPCYCGCERVGHKANQGCFVKSRDAEGHVTEWDTHGMGCSICLGVGRAAMLMFQKGMTVQQIRAEIDRTYGSHYQSHTPTPDPPGYHKS